MTAWRPLNGRYSITDGTIVLIVPWNGPHKVGDVLNYLNLEHNLGTAPRDYFIVDRSDHTKYLTWGSTFSPDRMFARRFTEAQARELTESLPIAVDAIPINPPHDHPMITP